MFRHRGDHRKVAGLKFDKARDIAEACILEFSARKRTGNRANNVQSCTLFHEPRKGKHDIGKLDLIRWRG